MALSAAFTAAILSTTLAAASVLQIGPDLNNLPTSEPPPDPVAPAEPLEPEGSLLAQTGQESFSPDDADVLRLYRAFLNREPDGEGARYWLGIRQGATLEDIASQFAASAEFQNTYGNVSNLEFLTVVYENVLGRQADAAGLDYWLGLVEQGVSRGQAVRWVTASTEFRTAHPYETMTLPRATHALLGRVGPRTCNGLAITVDLNKSQMPTEGDDVILGTVDSDVIYALGGDDVVCGSNGDDLIVGGAGADLLFGEAGNDQIFGGADDDQILGERGDDQLVGGPGRDTIYGGSGDDEIFGGPAQDYLLGEDGDDIVVGGDGDESSSDDGFGRLLVAGIYGGDGDDQLFGTGGNDALYGGDGNDILAGGDGDDIQLGRYGPITGLYGGAGADQIFGGAGNDALFGEGGPDLLSGGPGNDQQWGGDFDDLLYGGDGDDRMTYISTGAGSTGSLERGDDIFFGGSGNDVINGMEGEDTIFGGPGDDDLAGGSGDDFLSGDEGIDMLTGDFIPLIASGSGADSLLLPGSEDVCKATGGSTIVADCEIQEIIGAAPLK